MKSYRDILIDAIRAEIGNLEMAKSGYVGAVIQHRIRSLEADLRALLNLPEDWSPTRHAPAGSSHLDIANLKIANQRQQLAALNRTVVRQKKFIQKLREGRKRDSSPGRVAWIGTIPRIKTGVLGVDMVNKNKPTVCYFDGFARDEIAMSDALCEFIKAHQTMPVQVDTPVYKSEVVMRPAETRYWSVTVNESKLMAFEAHPKNTVPYVQRMTRILKSPIETAMLIHVCAPTESLARTRAQMIYLAQRRYHPELHSAPSNTPEVPKCNE